LQRGHQTEDRAAESRLSGPVGADHPHKLAGLNLERDILKCNHPREPEGGMVEVNDRGRLTYHVGEDSSQSKPLKPMPIGR
jgi:hypothetical protein